MNHRCYRTPISNKHEAKYVPLIDHDTLLTSLSWPSNVIWSFYIDINESIDAAVRYVPVMFHDIARIERMKDGIECVICIRYVRHIMLLCI